MILGAGVELVDVARFERALARHGERLTHRLFTADERAYAARRTARAAAQSLAVRFAAKVAARRALGGEGVALRDVEVVRVRGRAPTLRFHARAGDAAAARGVTGSALTLTHDPFCCIGHVLLERQP